MANNDITSILRPRAASRNEVKSLDELTKALSLKPETKKEIAQVSRKHRADILNDQPATSDRLGMASLARTLGDIAFSDNTQTPLTICVNGKWGTGKTSILKMVEFGG
ncbi:MAG: P-loop NTPase fold protein [Anaerolineales bacterium]